MPRLLENLRAWLVGHWVIMVALLLVTWVTLGTVLSVNEGEPSVPLDDAFIHFQFARAFSSFTPFTYTLGSPPVAGATSLLWRLWLAPCFWLGVSGEGIIWFAWFWGFCSLGLLVHETHQAARGLVSEFVAQVSAGMVLCFGGLVWLAASGMEAVPFAWLWMRSARKLAEYWEGTATASAQKPLVVELLVLSVATPLMRPEGTLVPLAVAVVLLGWGGKRQRWAAPLAALAALIPPLLFWLGTGQFSTTTSLVKWLPNNPYLTQQDVMLQVLANLKLLYTTLLNGDLWSASVLPTGGKWIAWCAVPALLVQGARRQRWRRALVIFFAALGLWLPATYDTFLWNRLRYLWPFAPAWFIGLGALCDLIADLAQRRRRDLDALRVLLAGVCAGSLLSKLPQAIDDVAASASGIRQQQVSLGRWAHAHLPPNARIGVNDTGAIAYFSKRPTFDIVGLTTPGEGRYWNAGAGSRFEHYERMERASLPTHFIVYPEWFALAPLLGEHLTERNVNASILGGTRMVAQRADYSTLGSAQRPRLDGMAQRPIGDALDVADLVSEAEHDYVLFDATQRENQIAMLGSWVDGMRGARVREQFTLDLSGASTLVARLDAEHAMSIRVSVAGKPLGNFELSGGSWQELSLPLPKWARRPRQRLELEADSGHFGAMHYWALREP